MKINNVELEDIDMMDVEIAEKYEGVLKNIEKMVEDVKDMKFSESIRAQCNSIFSVFNVLFGPGTDKKVFGEKVNLLTCLKSFEELAMILNSQTKDVQKIADKYSPNRVSKNTKK